MMKSRRLKALSSTLLCAVLVLTFACARGSDALPADENPCTGPCGSTGSGGADGSGGGATTDVGSKFELVAEWDGTCAQSVGAIDVNLGHSAENFVKAAYCQINGVLPDDATVKKRSSDLRTFGYVRRIDVVRQFCKEAGKSCSLTYSNPWKTQLLHTESCTKKTKRELGAIFMYFSECSGGVNCDMDWANTHALGMRTASSVYGYADHPTGLYNPGNAGFWQRELLDARYAGLSFLALNTYGPDLSFVDNAVKAANVVGGIKLALFDDTWGWGRGDSPWNVAPDFSNATASANAIFTNKWKPFYDKVGVEHRYEYQGKPLIYFYNAGTLKPRNQSAAVISKLKELFKAEYGVEPFMVIDAAFFEDPAMDATADARFVWNTFTLGDRSRSEFGGVIFDHFMTKWDALGRDHLGAIATSADLVVKDDALLTKYLASSADADLAVVGTWNDLGEGTGVHRNYDYYVKGEWKEPTWLLAKMRASQCQ